MEKYIENHIKELADENIVAIISQYLQLQKHGSDWIGLCPFHSDHKPSLHISESKKVWKCFACGASGDCISFLMKFLNIGYVEALQVVADRYGIDTQNKPYKATKQPQRVTIPTKENKPTQPQEIGEIPSPFLCKSMKQTGRLFDRLFPYIGTADLKEVWDNYCVGATTDGKEVFWCFTADNVIRYCKVLDYGTDGHRRHGNGSCYALHPTITAYMKKRGLWADNYEPVFKQILYGGHIINDFPDRLVAVVESEKTAVICACLIPTLTWCAVGGKNNLNAEMLAPCKGHSVLLFPDMDARQEWSDKAQQLRTQGFDIQVLEWWQGVEDVGDKYDIADVLMRDAQPIDKFTDEQWEAMACMEDEPQQPTDAQAILDEMCKRNPAIALLVEKLDLVVVGNEDTPTLTPLRAACSTNWQKGGVAVKSPF